MPAAHTINIQKYTHSHTSATMRWEFIHRMIFCLHINFNAISILCTHKKKTTYRWQFSGFRSFSNLKLNHPPNKQSESEWENERDREHQLIQIDFKWFDDDCNTLRVLMFRNTECVFRTFSHNAKSSPCFECLCICVSVWRRMNYT